MDKLKEYVELAMDKLGDNKKVVVIGLAIVAAIVIVQVVGG